MSVCVCVCVCIYIYIYIYITASWTITASDVGRITAAEMKYMRRTAGYTWTYYQTKAQIAKELKITPILDELLEYKKSRIQHVNRMPRNRLRRVMKYYSPTGRSSHSRPLKRLLDAWDRNGSTSGPTPWKIYDDEEDEEEEVLVVAYRLLEISSLKWTGRTSVSHSRKTSFISDQYKVR